MERRQNAKDGLVSPAVTLISLLCHQGIAALEQAVAHRLNCQTRLDAASNAGTGLFTTEWESL